MNILFCEKCCHILGEYGVFALETYEVICNYYAITGKSSIVDESDKFISKIVDFLEKKGFVVSTETKKEVIVKPIDYKLIESGILFCSHAEHID